MAAGEGMYQSIDQTEIEGICRLPQYKRQLEAIRGGGAQSSNRFEIDAFDLLNVAPKTFAGILDRPMKALPSINKCLGDKVIRSRVRNIPPIEGILLTSIPKSADVGHLIVFRGTVTRAGQLKTIEKSHAYQCSKCGTLAGQEYDISTASFNLPSKCDGRNRDGSVCGAGASSFEPCTEAEDEAGPVFRDYQEIRIQESVDAVEMGSIPKSITAILLDDLVDSCSPGDQVLLTGIVRRRWSRMIKNERCDIEIVLEANNVEVLNQHDVQPVVSDSVAAEFQVFWAQYRDTPLEGRNFIVSQFASNIFGMDIVRLAIMMQLVGGVRKTETGTTIRGDSHVLLAGDPGTGKSQFLKFATKLLPRSVLTTGIGSTTAGLTCSAIKDGGEWQLEAGAIVLADGGLCCIDEFGSIKSGDKTSIHEAMEQQTISVAKAGLVCKLNTRCSILAATNPKGNYDAGQSLEVNLNLGSPLLSRFDLIFILLDGRDLNWDLAVSNHILLAEVEQRRSTKTESWSIDKLRSYILYCKRFRPEISSESQQLLSAYYMHQRRSDYGTAVRTTIRLLESLIRLAQSHARLMCRQRVTIQDAVMAIIVMESTVFATGLLGNQAVKITSSFSISPDVEYANAGKTQFTYFAMSDEIV